MTGTPLRLRHDAATTKLLVGMVAAVCLAAIASITLDWRLLIPLGLGLPLVVIVILTEEPIGVAASISVTSVHRPDPSKGQGRGSDLRLVYGDAWLSMSWAVLFFGSTFTFLTGPRPVELASSGSVSLDNLVALLSFVPPALVVVSAIRDGWRWPTSRLAQLFGVYALLALFSATWSQLPHLSTALGLQLLVLASFVAYCAGRAAAEPGFADRLLVRILRYITVGVLAMAALGVLEGALGSDRFTWRGQHPNGAAAIMLVPCLALLFHPRRSFITRPIPWWVVPIALLPLVYATGSRANVAGAAVAAIVGWLLATMRNAHIGVWGLGGSLILLGTATAVAADRVAAWLMRDQTTDEVGGLNGRIELWEWALENPLGSEVWGIGAAAARGAWAVSWNPRNVHSAWLDILSTLGVIGLALMGAVVLSLLALVVLRRSVQAGWMATLVTIASLNSVTIARTEYALILLCLAMFLIADAEPKAPT